MNQPAGQRTIITESDIVTPMALTEGVWRDYLSGVGIPDCYGFRLEPDNPQHSRIVQRCIAYYQRLTDTDDLQARQNNDIWGQVHQQQYGEFEQALAAHDEGKVSAILRNMFTTHIVDGFTDGIHFSYLSENPQLRAWSAQAIFDTLFSLAAAFGYPIPCAEQPADNLGGFDFEEILDFVLTKAPALRQPPRAGGGTFGIRTNNGLIAVRDLFATYNATRVREILNSSAGRVCEIGGGVGCFAYFTASMGVPVDVYDLPVISIIQSYFLMSSLDESRVWIYGEEPNESAEVRLFPWWELDNAHDGQYVMAINIDSMPEIELKIARNYIDLIHAKATHWFFSVNQEAQAVMIPGIYQAVVADLTAQHGGFDRRYRFPYWPRFGYVEELFEIRK